MLNPTFTLSLAQSISDVILAPAIRHAADVTHVHVLLDTIQKIRHPRYYTHPDFVPGYLYGQTYYNTHAPVCPFALDEVIALLRDNLARHDHEDLNVFSQLLGCPPIDYAYRVGFTLGWLLSSIMGRHPSIPRSLVRCNQEAMMKKSLRRKRRSPKKSTYVPVDPSGDPIHVLSFSSPQPPKQPSLSPEEMRRYQAPLNSHNDGFHLLR